MAEVQGTRWRGLLAVVAAIVVVGGLGWQGMKYGWFDSSVEIPQGSRAPPRPAPAPTAGELAAREKAQLRAQHRAREAQLEPMLAAIQAAEAIADPEARCLAIPDPPGSHWPAGAAAARCALLRPPRYTLATIAAHLRNADVATLHRDFAGLLEAHYRDPAQVEQIFLAYSVFDASAEARRVAERWRRLAPRDPFALTAVGVQRTNAAFAARGSAWAAQTSEESFAAMNEEATAAWPALDAALAAEPRMLPACVAAARLGRVTGDDERQVAALVHCLDLDPAAFHVLQEMLIAARPKWGGSEAAIAEVAAKARSGIASNPLLSSLGSVDWTFRADASADPQQRAAAWRSAIARAPVPAEELVAAADAILPVDPWESMLMLTQALRFDPCDQCWRTRRGRLLLYLQRPDWAESDLQPVVVTYPTDFWLVMELQRARQLRSLQQRGEDYDPENVDFDWFDWMSRNGDCMTMQAAAASDPRAAALCSADLVEKYPEDPYTWFVRVRHLSVAGDAAEIAMARARLAATIDPALPEQVALLAAVDSDADAEPR